MHYFAPWSFFTGVEAFQILKFAWLVKLLKQSLILHYYHYALTKISTCARNPQVLILLFFYYTATGALIDLAG